MNELTWWYRLICGITINAMDMTIAPSSYIARDRAVEGDAPDYFATNVIGGSLRPAYRRGCRRC